MTNPDPSPQTLSLAKPKASPVPLVIAVILLAVCAKLVVPAALERRNQAQREALQQRLEQGEQQIFARITSQM